MRRLIILLLAFITLVSLGACEGIMKNVVAGQVKADLGDGYNASFELPSAENAYDVEVIGPTTLDFVVKGKRYELYIYPTGKDDPIASILFSVYSDPWMDPIPKDERIESKDSSIGAKVNSPMTIDDSRGYVAYIWPAGDAGVDVSKAMWMFFRYYPHAWEEDGSLKSNFVVNGDSSSIEDHPSSIKVMKSIIDSIHIIGPGI